MPNCKECCAPGVRHRRADRQAANWPINASMTCPCKECAPLYQCCGHMGSSSAIQCCRGPGRLCTAVCHPFKRTCLDSNLPSPPFQAQSAAEDVPGKLKEAADRVGDKVGSAAKEASSAANIAAYHHLHRVLLTGHYRHLLDASLLYVPGTGQDL
jgi:hypothetical protein